MEAIRTKIAYMCDVFAFADIDDLATREVLEVGSGFGIGVMATACLGARRAHGLELVSWQVDWAEKCVAALHSDVGDHVAFVRGSASELPYENGLRQVRLDDLLDLRGEVTRSGGGGYSMRPLEARAITIGQIHWPWHRGLFALENPAAVTDLVFEATTTPTTPRSASPACRPDPQVAPPSSRQKSTSAVFCAEGSGFRPRR